MLDLARMRRVRIRPTPWGQILVANLILWLDYHFPRRTEIVLEGLERIPRGRAVCFAMNHTDRFNYWPFQYAMYRSGELPFTVTWVKGKYYEKRAQAFFMEQTNNIPIPSRGYVITTEFRRLQRRAPSRDEYRTLREVVDGQRQPGDLPAETSADVRAVLEKPGFLAEFRGLFESMMGEVLRLHRAAFEQGHNLLVFPQGTRSKRLLPGHTGIAQMAQHFGVPIVPVACNGCDRLYPGNSPLSKGGRVVYRIGEPLEVDGPELAPYRVGSGAVPFTDGATADHGPAYRAITDLVMDRINLLLDAEYQRAQGETPGDAAEGVERFI